MNIQFHDAKYIRDEQKNNKLILERWISFEDLVKSIRNWYLLDCIDNPSSNHNNQKLLLVIINDYIYAVPIIINNDHIFMKTWFPCRKYKKYLS